MKRLIIIEMVVFTVLLGIALGMLFASIDTADEITTEHVIIVPEELFVTATTEQTTEPTTEKVVSRGYTGGAERIPSISLSEEEFDLLCRLVSAESKGESFEGKIAVANVVLNRVNSPKWEDTITEVIYTPNQFQPVSNGAINQEPTEESVEAVKEALKGVKVVADNVDCFAHKSISFESWADYYATIGNHKFWVSHGQ